MRLFLKNIEDLDFKCDTLILPLIEGDGMSPYEDVDRVLSGLPSGVISSGKFHAKSNKTLLLQTCEKIPSKSILLIGLGRKEKISGDTLRQAGGTAASCLSDSGQAEIALSTRSISHLGLKPTDFIEGSLLSHYCFNRYKGEKDFKRIRKLTVLSADKLKTRIRKIEVIAAATHFARDLVNTPSNDMTPSALVKAARTLRNISVKVIDKKEAERLHMGAFLSVAKGSREPPKFIVLTYKGSGGHPVVLIGKAITFDSGGLSLKPGEGMDKMKYDMAGGAAVLGAMKAVSEMNLPVHLVGVLPATENMPGGASSKPGDVVRAIDGRTIEIINTDAEGRLVLADAIGYVKKIRPSAIIDIATLTGACSVANLIPLREQRVSEYVF
jgi:leucyl aminopeptidase